MDMTQAPPQTLPRTPADSPYVRNLCALWESDPRLAMALESVHEDDVPPLEPAREGGWTVKVPAGGGGAPVYLHSRYRPVAEARAWADAVKSDNRYAVVVCGFGLGYHVKALWERLGGTDGGDGGGGGDVLIVVAEPNLPLLKAALAAEDYSDMLRGRPGILGGGVMLVTSLDRGQLVERLEPRSVVFTAGAGTLLTSHPASMQAAPAFFSAFQKLITEFIAFTRTGFVTLMLNNVATCRNIANNLGRYVTTPPIDVFAGAFKGRPAVLVAAGPSLAKNMHLLRELVGPDPAAPRRAVIIAVQTMLKPLLAAGFEPDFVTSLDYNTVSTRFFENLADSGGAGGGGVDRVHLTAEAKANWNVLDIFPGTMSLTQNDFADKLLRGAGFPARAGLKAGATVAHLSFYLAEFLGCDPVILVGQDLGFVAGLYYKPGTAIHETWGVELGRFNTLETKEWERIVRSRLILRKIPDIHGHPMYTEEQFFVYLQQFERDFAASRCRVIDATEGGARKQGVQVMTLRQAIDQFCSEGGGGGGATGLHNLGADPCPSPRPWKSWSCDALANLRQAREALLARRAEGLAMKQTCETTTPLLEEMLAHQQDEPRMNRLFIEVDRARARVGSDPQTFEMISLLNTIGELRRFQADLGVKGAKSGSLDHQRRQLLRDMDYVANLKVGAERLIEIVDEALGRLDKQIAAFEAGAPWPREVAGA
jgi:hypothetical protein